MAEMTPIERLFALRAAPCFRRLHQSEQNVLARVAEERTFAAGEVVLRHGQVPSKLYVVVEGGLESADGTPAGAIVGAEGVLCGAPVRHAVCAAKSSGARCLVFGKAHLFTAVYQCPPLLVGLLEGEGEEPTGGGKGAR